MHIEWGKIFNVLSKKHQPKILYSMKLFFKNKEEIKTYLGEYIMRKFTSRPALKEMLTEFFRKKENIGQKLRFTYKKEEHQRRNK